MLLDKKKYKDQCDQCGTLERKAGSGHFRWAIADRSSGNLGNYAAGTNRKLRERSPECVAEERRQPVVPAALQSYSGI